MATILRIRNKASGTTLFDFNDPTGVNNPFSVKTDLLSDLNDGGLRNQRTFFTPMSRSAPRLMSKQFLPSIMSWRIRARATSIDNLRSGHIELVNLLDDPDGKEIEYLPTGATDTLYADYYPIEEIQSLIRGQELALYEILTLLDDVRGMPISLERGPWRYAELGPTTNKLRNSTLAFDFDGDGIADGWTFVALTNVQNEQTDADDEAQYFELTSTTERLFRPAQSSLYVTAASGDIWTFHFWGKVTSPGRLKARIEYLDAADAVLATHTTSGFVTDTTFPTSGRGNVTITTTAAPASTAKARVSIVGQNSGAGTGLYWVKNAQLEQASSATLYAIGEEIVSNEGVGSRVAWDDCSDASTDTWDPANEGGAYTLDSGTAANFDSASGVKTIDVDGTVNTDHRGVLTTLSIKDVDAIVNTGTPSALPTGANIENSLIVRRTAATTYYRAVLIITPAGAMSLRLEKNVASTVTVLSTKSIAGTYVGGDYYRIRLSAVGRWIKASTWKAETSGPTPSEMIEVFDTSIQAAGGIGMGGIIFTGGTLAPPGVRFDDLTVWEMTNASGIMRRIVPVYIQGSAPAFAELEIEPTAGTVSEALVATRPSHNGANRLPDLARLNLFPVWRGAVGGRVTDFDDTNVVANGPRVTSKVQFYKATRTVLPGVESFSGRFDNTNGALTGAWDVYVRGFPSVSTTRVAFETTYGFGGSDTPLSGGPTVYVRGDSGTHYIETKVGRIVLPEDVEANSVTVAVQMWGPDLTGSTELDVTVDTMFLVPADDDQVILRAHKELIAAWGGPEFVLGGTATLVGDAVQLDAAAETATTPPSTGIRLGSAFTIAELQSEGSTSTATLRIGFVPSASKSYAIRALFTGNDMRVIDEAAATVTSRNLTGGANTYFTRAAFYQQTTGTIMHTYPEQGLGFYLDANGATKTSLDPDGGGMPLYLSPGLNAVFFTLFDQPTETWLHPDVVIDRQAKIRTRYKPRTHV